MTYTVSTLIDTDRESWGKFKKACKRLKTPIRRHIAVVVSEYVSALQPERVEILPLGTIFGVAARGEVLIASVMKRRRCTREQANAYILSMLADGNDRLEEWLMRKGPSKVCRYMVPKVHGKAGRPKKVAP